MKIRIMRLFRNLPRFWTYYVGNGDRHYYVLYVWAFNRKWDLVKVRISEEEFWG